MSYAQFLGQRISSIIYSNGTIQTSSATPTQNDVLYDETSQLLTLDAKDSYQSSFSLNVNDIPHIQNVRILNLPVGATANLVLYTGTNTTATLGFDTPAPYNVYVNTSGYFVEPQQLNPYANLAHAFLIWSIMKDGEQSFIMGDVGNCSNYNY